MILLIIWEAVWVLLVPISFTYFVYKCFRKYLWCVPIIALILTGLMFLGSVAGLNEGSLIGNIKYYFTQDWSIPFYLLYVPIVIVSFITTMALYSFSWIKTHR